MKIYSRNLFMKIYSRNFSYEIIFMKLISRNLIKLNFYPNNKIDS